jgi:hypothetical protein
MSHEICDACEWVALCTKRQHCVPITVEDAAARLHRVMHIPIKREEADAPVSTPEQTMRCFDIYLLVTTGIAAVITGATVWLNWPLFLAAVK